MSIGVVGKSTSWLTRSSTHRKRHLNSSVTSLEEDSKGKKSPAVFGLFRCYESKLG